MLSALFIKMVPTLLVLIPTLKIIIAGIKSSNKSSKKGVLSYGHQVDLPTEQGRAVNNRLIEIFK